jgi:hypothetical protein
MAIEEIVAAVHSCASLSDTQLVVGYSGAQRATRMGIERFRVLAGRLSNGINNCQMLAVAQYEARQTA